MTATSGNLHTDWKLDPVFVIAGWADVSPKWPDEQNGFVWTILEKTARKVEKLWNDTWALDPNPNSHWIGKLWEYLKSQFWKNSEIVTISWSGSASPLKEKEAQKAIRDQLSDVARKYPWRPIIAICKSLSGPYLVRAIQEKKWLIVTQLLTLWSPWGLKDTIPDNVWDAIFIESEGDIFYKIGNIFRFLNLKHKTPKRIPWSDKSQPNKITLTTPTHGGLNYDTLTGPIETQWDILEGLDPKSMYQLLQIIIQRGLSSHQVENNLQRDRGLRSA